MSAFYSVLAVLVLFCPLGGDGWRDRSDGQQSDPVVAFVQPDGATMFDEPLTYGSIQVEASDPDVGDRNGDGIRRVEMVIIDRSNGDVVASRSEYWPTYDFGPNLPDGDYELVATAKSSWWAGGTSSTVSLNITVDTAPDPAPPATAPPTTAPSTTVPPDPAPPTLPADDVDRANARSLQLLNELRSQQGLGSVASDQTMAAFARDWSAEMSRSGFRHSTGPYAENIVWHSDASLTPEQAAEQFHELWVNSPGHYANMTDPRWTLVGVGLHLDDSGWWGTHVFR